MEPNLTLPPTTTLEEDRHRRSQRLINRIWEYTQAAIAVSVVGCALYVDGTVALGAGQMTELQSSALMQLNVMAALVTGFYFGRTNHERVGGVYSGR